ncbi:uncharacterized protein LOC144377243 isoform X2 [Ictidomys tridecemlineatus]
MAEAAPGARGGEARPRANVWLHGARTPAGARTSAGARKPVAHPLPLLQASEERVEPGGGGREKVPGLYPPPRGMFPKALPCDLQFLGASERDLLGLRMTPGNLTFKQRLRYAWSRALASNSGIV